MDRRTFLKGMAGILAASVAPGIVQAANIMPVKPLKSGILVPEIDIIPDSLFYAAIYDPNDRLLAMSQLDVLSKDGSVIVGPEESKFHVKRRGTVSYMEINMPYDIEPKRINLGSHSIVDPGDDLTIIANPILTIS